MTNTPCFMDNRFISPVAEVMREAAKECRNCPVWEACRELGLGEPDNVYGGTVPTDPIRRAARKAATSKTCPQGHPRKDYGVMLEGPGLKPVPGCVRCAALQLHVTEGEAGPMPVTRKIKGDTINHGTEAGYKAHKRRGEDACTKCLRGKRQADVRRELAAMEETA